LGGGVDGTLIKMDLGVRVWIGLNKLAYGIVEGFSLYGNELPGYIKYGEFLD
jgi:hypothetical protein